MHLRRRCISSRKYNQKQKDAPFRSAQLGGPTLEFRLIAARGTVTLDCALGFAFVGVEPRSTPSPQDVNTFVLWNRQNPWLRPTPPPAKAANHADYSPSGP